MSYLLILILAGLSAYLASKKGRRPVLWFLIGLFFPVVGLIIVALLPSMRAIPPGQWSRQPGGNASGGMPGGWDNLRSGTDPNSQYEAGRNPQPGQNGSGYNPEWTRPSWASPQPEQGNQQPGQSQAVQICPQCGATVDENARYCENCGHKLRFKFNLDKSSDETLESARHCPSCNRLVRKNVGWCPHCGYKLKENG